MKNQYTLITGASSGIGYEFSKLFAKNGYNLVLVARDTDALEKVRQELMSMAHIHIITISKDLSLPQAPQEIYDTLQKQEISIDVLVNNAGFGLNGTFASLSLESQMQMIGLNVQALTALTHLFVQPMIEKKQGRILLVASTAGFVAGEYMAVYYATKAYVVSFAQAIGLELQEKGVSVSALCPGPTRTNFAKNANMELSLLFSMGTMESGKVAQIGYDGLMRGKRIIIPGLRNKLSVFALRFAPRNLANAIVARSQKI